jgi:hypothetical protein
MATMPLESIACTHCGSSEVTEFKPGTYACLHCEGVFKYADPTTLVVTQEKAFCWCGNEIVRKCFFCGVGLCRYHDALCSDEIAAPVNEAIGTTVGYALRASREHVVTYQGVQVVTRWPVSTAEMCTVGPVMPLAKVKARLQAEGGGPVQFAHAAVCVQCARAKAEEVAAEQVSGAICTSPRCLNDASETCECCRRRFCAPWLIRNLGIHAQILSGRMSVSCSPGWVTSDAGLVNASLTVAICRSCQGACFMDVVAEQLPAEPLDPTRTNRGYWSSDVAKYRRSLARYYDALVELAARMTKQREASLRIRLSVGAGADCKHYRPADLSSQHARPSDEIPNDAYLLLIGGQDHEVHGKRQ